MLRILGQAPVQLFSKRYNLKPRAGSDDRLRDFPDEPIPLPPISCLLRGCEHVWCNNVEEFQQHCDDKHEGEQTYRLRCLHLLSENVWQVKGSLQRAAVQNFAEFQVRSQTEWKAFTPQMNGKLDEDN